MYQVFVEYVFFAAVTVCSTNFGLLSWVPSNIRNSSFIVTTAALAYFFCDCFFKLLLLVDRKVSPCSHKVAAFFFLHPNSPHSSWIFKCIISPSFICFLYHKIMACIFSFLYLPHFSNASPDTRWQCHINNCQVKAVEGLSEGECLLFTTVFCN